MSHILVVGAGPVGLASALALALRGHRIHLVASSLPGEGITGDLAAGIGCIFKPSSELIRRLVIESYPHSMQLAGDPSVPAVAETDLRIVKSGGEAQYRDLVLDYEDVDDTFARYTTFAFDPAAWGAHRLAQLKQAGASVEQRALRADEVERLLRGESLEGFDHTIVATGLSARDMRPDLGLFPVRGVLVHFPESSDKRSYMDEENARYVISRPNGVVAGGTFDPHVGTCPEPEQLEIARRIVAECNDSFGTALALGDRVRITVGYRPAVPGDAVMELGDKVSWLNGFGGQGWVTWATVSEHVAAHFDEPA